MSKYFFHHSSYLDVETYKDTSKVEVISKSSEESLAIAKLDSCPACFGDDLCSEIKERFLTVSIFGSSSSYGTVYQVIITSQDLTD